MRRAAFILACTALVALGGCSRAPAGDGYFPLEAGHHWVYEQQSEWENNTADAEQVELLTLGEDRAAGAPAWHRRSVTGMDYWLKSDSSGIYRVAAKADNQEEPQPDEPARYVLKTPLQVGTQWKAPTTAYLLKRRQDFPPEVRHSAKPVLMTYTIDAVGQPLATRAGKFNDCLRVKGEARIRLFADPVNGFQDMPLSTTEWYCKGVGLVRLERQEPASSTFLTGGTLKMELISWQ